MISNKKISELPPYVGGNLPSGDLPISILGTTYKIDTSKLTPPTNIDITAMHFKGKLNADTNDLGLANGVGTLGDIYEVITAGVMLGLTLKIGDFIVYDGGLYRMLANNNQSGATTTDTLPEGGTNLYFTLSRVRNTVLTGFNSAITWARVTASSTLENAISLLQKQSDYLQSTRVTGGFVITINADPTKFDIVATGEIVDPITFATTPISVSSTGVLAIHRSAQVESFVWVDSTNVIVQSLTPPNPLILDDIIGYGVLIHSNLSTINVVNLFPYFSDGLGTKINQLLYYIGFSKFKNTNKVSAGTTGTRLSHSGGNVIRSGGGNTTKRPVFNLTGATDATFRMRNQNDVEGADTQIFDVTNIDVAGTTTALVNNKFSAAKVWKFGSSLIRVQRGQYSYDNYDSAMTGKDNDLYIDSPNGDRNGIFIGWIVFKKGTTWTGGTSGVDYKFVDVSNGKSSGSGFTATLQSIYNLSVSPQIITDAIRGALRIKGGTGTDTDNVFEGANNAGTVTTTIRASGAVTASTDLVTKAHFDANPPAVVDASEIVAGKVNITTQTFGGNKTIVGSSSATGNAFEVQNLAHTKLIEVLNAGDIIINGIRIGRGKGYIASNTTIGNAALNASSPGVNNTSIGADANGACVGSHNTAIGSYTMYGATGSNNTAIGVLALAVSSGVGNTAMGRNALTANTSGSNNSAIGNYALNGNTTGNYNSAIGDYALSGNTSGVSNSGIGQLSLENNTSGNGNVGFGSRSGRFIADGVTPLTVTDNSLFLGANTRANGNNQTNQIVIGDSAIGNGSNTTKIGNSSITKAFISGALGVQVMTTTQKNAIASPTAGLMVFDTTLMKLCVYTTAWETITSI
jgi:hypothetical protein